MPESAAGDAERTEPSKIYDLEDKSRAMNVFTGFFEVVSATHLPDYCMIEQPVPNSAFFLASW